MRSAAAPTSGTCLVHVWSTRHRNRAVRNGLQRYVVSQVASAIQGKQAPGQNPDKDEVRVQARLRAAPAAHFRDMWDYSSATLALRLKLKESASGSRDE
jgi:hypothetical protein